MDKDSFFELYDAYINRVYSHFYASSPDKERALNYAFIFFARVWDQCGMTSRQEIAGRIEALLQDKK